MISRLVPHPRRGAPEVGGNIPCFGKPVAKGDTTPHLESPRRNTCLDHLIAGCVTTAAQFPSISADPTF